MCDLFRGAVDVIDFETFGVDESNAMVCIKKKAWLSRMQLPAETTEVTILHIVGHLLPSYMPYALPRY